MIVSEIRLRFNKFATMKIKSYKDGNQVKKYVSTGKEKKAVVGAVMTGLQGLTSIGTGIADYRAGKREAERRAEEIQRLKATAPSLETPAAFRQAVKDAYDRSLLESQQREITRQLGTSVGALQQAGGRALLGGIGAATQQAALMGERAAQSQAQTQLGALSQLGQAELSTQRLRENRYQRELAQQRQLRAQAEAGAGAGLGSIIGGALSAGTIGLGAAGALGGDIKKAMLGDFTKDDGTGEEPTGTDAFIPKVFPKTLGLQTAIAGRQPTNKELVEQGIRMGIYPEGYKEGGVMKTNGEFSHEKNPIDLVQNGEKVGEATGGEYIFNPQQSRKMNELAKKATEGGSKSQKANAMQKLAKFVRTTLKRFEKDLG
jgi:hypothetical protein